MCWVVAASRGFIWRSTNSWPRWWGHITLDGVSFFTLLHVVINHTQSFLLFINLPLVIFPIRSSVCHCTSERLDYFGKNEVIAKYCTDMNTFSQYVLCFPCWESDQCYIYFVNGLNESNCGIRGFCLSTIANISELLQRRRRRQIWWRGHQSGGKQTVTRNENDGGN